MKTLYLIRHAKSDWNNPNLTDFERPLNKRGLRDAPFMGKELAKLNFKPELIVCSPANRTTSTAKFICTENSYSIADVTFDQSIYESSIDNLISLINLLPNEKTEVALIGHNPSMTGLSNYLTDEYIGNMPTCSIVKIELEIENWDEVITGIGAIKFYIYPKKFA
jgi:phosphohistidine phosphatase